MHEVTHAIETDSMKQLVENFAKQNKDFNKALTDLKQTYGTEDVSSEVLADISGQLFGYQEFINNLSMKQPNIFKRLYNSIISLANKITGNSKESRFIKDLKNKWETAYRNTTTEQAISNINESKNHLSKNALNEVNDTLNNPNTDINSMVKLRDYTPEQLVSVGVKDLPMLVRKGHLRENILTSAEAKNKGYSIKGKHYHGLGIDTYMKAIDSLDNPIAVYQYTDKGNYSKDNFIVLTEVKDDANNNIIVPIEIHKKGQYNKIEIDTNRIKTTYGRETTNYFNNMVKNGNLIKIYNKKRSAKLPMQSGNFNTSTDNTIPQSNTNVKSEVSTKYSMQESTNNTQNDNVSNIIETSINKAIDDLGDDGKFDTERNTDSLYEEIWEYVKEKLNRNLTDNEYQLINEMLEDTYEDGYYVSKDNKSIELQLNDLKNSLSDFVTEHEYFKENESYIKNNINKDEFFKNIKNSVSQLQNIESFISELSDIEEPSYISTSKKSVSTYIDMGKETLDNKGMINFLLKYGTKDNGITELTTEDIETLKKDLDSNYFTIRISDHNVGSKFNFETQTSFDYNSGDIFIPLYKIDTKYSMQNDTWQEHLEKNYKATGTRTKFSDIRQKNQVSEVSKVIEPVVNDIKTISRTK